MIVKIVLTLMSACLHLASTPVPTFMEALSVHAEMAIRSMPTKHHAQVLINDCFK